MPVWGTLENCGTSDETFSLDLEKTVYRIGREGDVVLKDKCVSKTHCCLFLAEDLEEARKISKTVVSTKASHEATEEEARNCKVFLLDNSTNGTFYKGEKIGKGKIIEILSETAFSIVSRTETIDPSLSEKDRRKIRGTFRFLRRNVETHEQAKSSKKEITSKKGAGKAGTDLTSIGLLSGLQLDVTLGTASRTQTLSLSSVGRKRRDVNVVESTNEQGTLEFSPVGRPLRGVKGDVARGAKNIGGPTIQWRPPSPAFTESKATSAELGMRPSESSTVASTKGAETLQMILGVDGKQQYSELVADSFVGEERKPRRRRKVIMDTQESPEEIGETPAREGTMHSKSLDAIEQVPDSQEGEKEARYEKIIKRPSSPQIDMGSAESSGSDTPSDLSDADLKVVKMDAAGTGFVTERLSEREPAKARFRKENKIVEDIRDDSESEGGLAQKHTALGEKQKKGRTMERRETPGKRNLRAALSSDVRLPSRESISKQKETESPPQRQHKRAKRKLINLLDEDGYVATKMQEEELAKFRALNSDLRAENTKLKDELRLALDAQKKQETERASLSKSYDQAVRSMEDLKSNFEREKQIAVDMTSQRDVAKRKERELLEEIRSLKRELDNRTKLCEGLHDEKEALLKDAEQLMEARAYYQQDADKIASERDEERSRRERAEEALNILKKDEQVSKDKIRDLLGEIESQKESAQAAVREKKKISDSFLESERERVSILQKYDAAAQEIKALELKVEEATAKETDSMREREQLSAALEEAKQRVAAETERASAYMQRAEQATRTRDEALEKMRTLALEKERMNIEFGQLMRRCQSLIESQESVRRDTVGLLQAMETMSTDRYDHKE